MVNSVNASSTTAAAEIKANFADQYDQAYPGVEARLSQVMRPDITSTQLTETYAYFLTSMYPRRWPRGQDIPSKAFDGVSFTATNLDWAAKVEFHDNDLQDDKLKKIMSRAQEAGAHFATLKERLLFQILRNATDAQLLATVPNGSDGSALFISTTRFGVTDGNIISGTGVATAAALQDDVFNAVEVFFQQQDTESQPLHDQSRLNSGGFAFLFRPTNIEVFAEVFKQNPNSASVSTAATQNLVHAMGWAFDFWPDQRITDSDIFVHAKGTLAKSIFWQTRQPLRENVQTMDNSDLARTTKVNAVQWDMRGTAAIGLPTDWVQINN